MTTSIRAAVAAALGPGLAERAVECAVDRVVLAVSGGLDSMVLLDVAVQVAHVPLVIATFDHGTGTVATAAADHVMQRSAELGVECVSARSPVALASEAELRGARWQFLRATAARAGAVIATAHTEDDQLETILLRVMRGAGARGIAGLYARGPIIRPLIGIRRRELEWYADTHRVRWVEDPSNASLRFARNRVRHEILPALRRVSPAIDAELLRIASQASELRDVVDAYVDRELRPRTLDGHTGLDVNAEVITRHSGDELAVLWPAIAARAGVTLDRRGNARLAKFSSNAHVGQRVQLSGDWEVVRSRDAFQLRASGDMGSPPQAIPAAGGRWDDWSFRPCPTDDANSAWSAWLPLDEPSVVRKWQPGDVMTSRQGGKPTLVKRLLSRAGVTGHDRSRWPVVLVGDQIVWIPGIRRSDAATARSGRPGLPFVCEYHTS